MTDSAEEIEDPSWIREYRIDLPRITLNVREAGNGPTMVFLHGITANAAVWDPILLTLAQDFKAVSVDQRGHGLSDKPSAAYTTNDFSTDVVDMIEALGSPAIVVGHSLGARNALEAARLRPDLITGVIAIDFTPFIESEVLDALEARVRGGDRSFADREEIMSYLSHRYLRIPRDAITRRAIHGYRLVDDVYRPLADPGAMAQTAAGLHDDLESTMRDIETPTLLIRGADSALVSREAFARTHALRPDLPTLEVSETDHYVPEEAPEVVSEAIHAFAMSAMESKQKGH
jgi:2-(acetamidomethylene)succinate hydrolase